MNATQLMKQFEKQRNAELDSLPLTEEQTADVKEARRLGTESFVSGAFKAAAENKEFHALEVKNRNAPRVVALLIREYDRAYKKEQYQAFHLAVMEHCEEIKNKAKSV